MENAYDIARSAAGRILAYHGTTATFDEYQIAKHDLGVHFGTQAQAEHRLFVKEAATGANVRPVYLKLSNPLRLEDRGSWQAGGVLGQFEEMGWFKNQDITKWYDSKPAEIRSLIESKGYDSIVYDNLSEGAGDSYIAFHPKQQVESVFAQKASTGISTAEKSSNRFLGDMDGFNLVGAALSHGDERGASEALAEARKYWKGPSTFGELRQLVESRRGEILIPGSVPVAKLAAAHTPVIEGLRHGGLAAKMRRIFSHFGSGWRGLHSAMQSAGVGVMPDQFFNLFASTGDAYSTGGGGVAERLNAFVFSRQKPITPSSYKRLTNVFQKHSGLKWAFSLETTQAYQKGIMGRSWTLGAYHSARDAQRWSFSTGFDPLFIRSSNASVMSDESLKLHERIHSFHHKNLGSDFIDRELEKVPTLNEAMLKGGMPESRIPAYVAEYEKRALRDQPGSLPTMETERLAYGYQNDPSFLERAERAGLETPITANKELRSFLSTNSTSRQVAMDSKVAREVMASSSSRAASGWLAKAAKAMGSRVMPRL